MSFDAKSLTGVMKMRQGNIFRSGKNCLNSNMLECSELDSTDVVLALVLLIYLSRPVCGLVHHGG